MRGAELDNKGFDISAALKKYGLNPETRAEAEKHIRCVAEIIRTYAIKHDMSVEDVAALIFQRGLDHLP